jgi:hypothetical protein
MRPTFRQDARTVARWIDSLPADGVERRAILEHPDPTFMCETWLDRDTGCGCLIGTACMARSGGASADPIDLRSLDDLAPREAKRWEAAGVAFARITDTTPPERAWAWAKRRAARGVTPCA